MWFIIIIFLNDKGRSNLHRLLYSNVFLQAHFETEKALQPI